MVTTPLVTTPLVTTLPAGLELHHLGVAVKDIEAGIAAYTRMFGYQLLHGPVDDPRQRVTVAFLGTAGGAEGEALQYELVAPLAGSQGSPIERFLTGISCYHVCYQVVDLEQSLSCFHLAGCTTIAPPCPAVAFGGRRIAWLLTPTNHLLELLEKHPRGGLAGGDRT
jgi:methylmalonyl-CoA/ethylmalonyl-CoA epimerase